jgi:hypothetical protein
MLEVALAVAALFILGLVVKSLTNLKFCVLCAGISLAWLGALGLYKINRFHNPTLLGLLVGQSITGLYYLAHKKLDKSLRIFSLPFVLTLTALSYFVLTSFSDVLPIFGLLAGLWLAAYLIFVYQLDSATGPVASKLIKSCCDD